MISLCTILHTVDAKPGNMNSMTNELQETVYSQRLLIIGGFLLMLAGMLFGDVFAVFILHPNADHIGGILTLAAQSVADKEPHSILGYFREIGALLENRGTKVDTHVHILKLGYLAILLAIMQPYVCIGQHEKNRLAQLFMIAACLMPPSIFLIHYVGLQFSPLTSIGWGSIFADLSGFFIILICIIEVVGLGLFICKRNTSAVPCALMKDRVSRVLLCAGTLMLMAGIIYGMFYAGLYMGTYEKAEVSNLQKIVSHAATDGPQQVSASLQSYALLQGERATKIAAHTHINEFGMLAILVAFIQPYIFLSLRWRRRWAFVLLAGSITLPLAVALEMRFGLLAGGVADVAGLLVFIALSAMLSGVVRYTGWHDMHGGDKG